MYNNESFVPSYVSIQRYILGKIETGEFAVGERIPPENELANMFSVTRTTANKAINELALLGVVERIKGKGTFVIDSMLQADIQVKAFSSQISAKLPRYKKHSLLRFGIVDLKKKAPEIASRFQESSLNSNIAYEIVRYIDNQIIDYSYVLCPQNEPFSFVREDMEVLYFHDYIKKYTTLKPSSIRLDICGSVPSFVDMSLLNKKPGDQVHVWATNIYDSKNFLLGTTITLCSYEDEQDFPLISFNI